MSSPPAPILGSQKLGVGARFIAPSALIRSVFVWLPRIGAGGPLLALLLLLLAPVSAKPAAPTPPPFLAGGDLSFLAAEEKGGAVYKENGRAEDALQIVKAHGWNVVRLRVWVNPDGQGMNVNSLPYTLTLAKRVKAAGLRILLDLHYSDTWADPGHQAKPAAWKDLPFEALTAQVRDYSRDTVAAFRKAGAMPDIVQVGNETTNGMLWPDGKVEEPDGWTKFGALFKAGVEGVREGAKPGRAPSIMLHIANGGDTGLVKWFFSSLDAKKQNIEFDVIGLSYYPDGKDTLDGLKTSLAYLADTYKKPIVVVETGFPRTGTPGADQPVHLKYGRTPDGQKQFLTDLAAAVKATPGGLGHGVVYWEPDWIGVPGLPHYGDANALFDDKFNALPGLGAIHL